MMKHKVMGKIIMVFALLLIGGYASGQNIRGNKVWSHTTITADTSYVPTENEKTGDAYYDVDNDTWSIVTEHNIYQVGQELAPLFKNVSGRTMYNGEVAYYSGAVGASEHIEFTSAALDGTFLPSRIVGILTEDIPDNGWGKVTWFGGIRNFDINNVRQSTDGAWAVDDILYASNTEESKMTNVMPNAPYYTAEMCVILSINGSNVTVFTRPTWNWKLSDMADVDGADPTTTGDLLTFDQISGVWDRGVFTISNEVFSDNWEGKDTIVPTFDNLYAKISLFESLNYCADSAVVNFGTIESGTQDSLCAVDNHNLVIAERAANPPFQVDFVFQGVERLQFFSFYGDYDGGVNHQVHVSAYNVNTLSWDFIGEFGSSTVKRWYSFPIYLPNNYIDNGEVKIRVEHQGSGITAHRMIFDYVEVNFGGTGGGNFITAGSVDFMPYMNITSGNVQGAIQQFYDLWEDSTIIHRADIDLNASDISALQATKQDNLTGTETVFDGWDKNVADDFSGDYNDLDNKPTIPTVNNSTITLQRNGSSIGIFTLNQAANETFNFIDENTQLSQAQVNAYELDPNWNSEKSSYLRSDISDTYGSGISQLLTINGRLKINNYNGGLRFGFNDGTQTTMYIHGQNGPGDDALAITRVAEDNYIWDFRGTLRERGFNVWHSGNFTDNSTSWNTAYTHSQLITGNPHDVLATEISDFDIAVSDNPDVLANTAKISANNSTITLQRNGNSIGNFTLNQATNETFNFIDENTQLSDGDIAAFGYIKDGNTNWDNSYGFITTTEANALYEQTLTKGNLTTSVTGLQLNATRQLIGGAADLSLTAGYVIPTATEQTNWNSAYSLSHPAATLSSDDTQILSLSGQAFTANFSNINLDYVLGNGNAALINRMALGNATLLPFRTNEIVYQLGLNAAVHSLDGVTLNSTLGGFYNGTNWVNAGGVAPLNMIMYNGEIRFRIGSSSISGGFFTWADMVKINSSGLEVSGNVKIDSDPYDATWGELQEAAPKDAIYDKIESIPTLSDGDKGDITVSSSGTVWNIDANTIGTTELSATGTPSSSTYLRGDNTWATISGSSPWVSDTYGINYQAGNVGIGRSSTNAFDLDVNGAGRFGGTVVMGSAEGTSRVTFTNSASAAYYSIGGTIWVSSADGLPYFNGTTVGTQYSFDLTTTSDFWKKKDFRPIHNALDKVLSLNTYAFNWKEDFTEIAPTGEINIVVNDDNESRDATGVIAQEIQDIMPEVVKTMPNTGYKAVDYKAIVPYLIEAIKEQQKQIDALKHEIELLK